MNTVFSIALLVAILWDIWDRRSQSYSNESVDGTDNDLDDPEEHVHNFGPWRLFEIVKITIDPTKPDELPQPKLYKNRITIHRICKVCGEIEYKDYDTSIVDSEDKLQNASNNLEEQLNETILYIPLKPAPKAPLPKCQHNWGKWAIISEISQEDHAQIVIEKYCTICGDVESKTYKTPYREDVFEVSTDLDNLRKHLTTTLLNPNQLTTNDILEDIILFANGVEFIEVSQCNKLAARLSNLINSRR